jgi:hypothetical protein
MSAKTVSQKKFAKLVASTGALSQPPGSLPRTSNLLFTQRGSLQLADGSLAISAPISPASLISTVGAFANLQAGQFPYYLLLAYSLSAQLLDVTNFRITSTGAGSNNPAGSYTFAIVANLGSAHTNAHNSSVTQTLPAFNSVSFAWNAVAGATGYTIYWVVRQPLQPFPSYISIGTPSGTSFTFTGVLPMSPAVVPSPTFNNTYELLLYASDGFSSLPPQVTFAPVPAGVFPLTIPQAATLAPGTPGFNATPNIPGFSPYGGISGLAGPLPMLVQFAGKSIIILGNGYPPQSYDPATGLAGPVTPLTNTFTAAYPSWQPGVSWLTGSQVTDGAGHYFTATQGGVSQTPGPPAWSTAKGTETADGSVIWTSNGPIVATVSPRGAAHAVAYAGSLWLANTSPSDTTDGIDGPSCIKMSDSNNPNSWNPVNTAFIGRNDGTQITGMQPFTIAALGISPTGSLCVFKEFTTYQIIGVFGSSSFEIQPAQTNLGCIAARSIQFLPGFGVCRYAHLGFAVFDGINDRLISEDIRPYLFGGVDSEADLTPIDPSFVYLSQSAQTITPPMYFCAMPLEVSPAGGTGSGQLTRLFCYDLVMKAWAVLDLPWPITALSTISVGEGYPLILAGKTDGTLQRMQSGDLSWDTGAGDQSNVSWSFRSPDIFGEGSSQRLYYKTVVLRGYGNAAMVQSIVANLWIDGQNIGSQAIDIVPQNDGHLFECQIKIWLNGYRAHLDISGNNGGGPGVIDALDWQVVPKATGTRRIIG